MASNFNCHLPGIVPAHVIANCPLTSQATAPPILPLHDVIVKNEPHDDDDDDGLNQDVPIDDVILGDCVSSHDVIKADLGPVAKEAPTGRTVLGTRNV